MVKSAFNINKKIILLTGSNGFLGKEYSKYLEKQGAVVIGLDNKNISSKKNHFFKCDLNNKKSIIETCKKINKNFPLIDAIINNASINESIVTTKNHNFFESNFNDFEDIMNINVRSILFLSKCLYKNLKKSKNGIIINIGSIYGNISPDNSLYNFKNSKKNQKNVSYTISKSAIIGLTRHMASVFSEYKIRVNCVSLGGVKNNQNSNFVKKYISKTLLGRMANKDEFNGLLHFLISDESKYITGQNIVCDGGYTII